MQQILDPDPIYGVPVVQLARLEDFRPAPEDPERIYLLHIGDGMELAFLVNSIPGAQQDLRVGFHAAKGASNTSRYYFSPVRSSRMSGSPYVLFSDPTLTLNPANRLSWYLGTPGVNPDDWMEAIVRTLLATTRSEYVVTEGSSGGGFTSMRFAARFSHAVAVPRIPQTDILRYGLLDPIRQTLRTAWPGMSYDDVMDGYSQRFRVVDLYSSPSWNRGNLIHYVHNTGDVRHTRSHLTPMLEELGGKSQGNRALGGRIAVVRREIGPGHIGIPSKFWPIDTEVALARLKDLRPLGTAATTPTEPMFETPRSAIRDAHTMEKRAASAALHFRDF